MTKRQESGFNWRGVEFVARSVGGGSEGRGRIASRPTLSFSLTLYRATGGSMNCRNFRNRESIMPHWPEEI